MAKKTPKIDPAKKARENAKARVAKAQDRASDVLAGGEVVDDIKHTPKLPQSSVSGHFAADSPAMKSAKDLMDSAVKEAVEKFSPEPTQDLLPMVKNGLLPNHMGESDEFEPQETDGNQLTKFIAKHAAERAEAKAVITEELSTGKITMAQLIDRMKPVQKGPVPVGLPPNPLARFPIRKK